MKLSVSFYKSVKQLVILLAVATLLLPPPAVGQLTGEQDQVVKQAKPYSPYVDQYFPQQVFFGDTHQLERARRQRALRTGSGSRWSRPSSC